jgi:hypothetical protein
MRYLKQCFNWERTPFSATMRLVYPAMLILSLISLLGIDWIIITTLEEDPQPNQSLGGNNGAGKILHLTYANLGTTDRFDRFIFPSLDTWHPTNQPYLVTVSKDWRERYFYLIQHNATWQRYSSRLEMLFVDCPDEDDSIRWDVLVCCKQQEGMLAVMNLSLYSQIDWLIVSDDDNYFRRPAIERSLRSLPYDQEYVITNGPSPEYLGKTGYLGAKSPYNCSKSKQFRFRWGQVSIYNRATLLALQRGLALGGLLAQCKEFDVAQDVGNSLFHWMYSLPNLWIDISPYCFKLVKRRKESLPFSFGCHGVSKAGSNSFPIHMVSLHSLYVSQSNAELYLWWNVSGFRKTSVYRQYGDPRQWSLHWHLFPVADCS